VNEKQALQAIYDLAMSRLRNPGGDKGLVTHDLGEIARLARSALGSNLVKSSAGDP